MYHRQNSEFALAAGIVELGFSEIDMIAGGTDWEGVLEGLGTAAAGVGLVAAGVGIAGGTGGAATAVGAVVGAAGVVAVIAGGAQVIEAAMKD